MIRTAVIGLLLLALVATSGTAWAQEPVDSDTHRQRAEQILDAPRFGEMRPSLWDRLADWLDDRLGSEPTPSDQRTGDAGSGAPGNADQSAGQPADGTDNQVEAPLENPGPTNEGASGDPRINGAPADEASAAGRGLSSVLQALIGLAIIVALALGARFFISRRSASTPKEKSQRSAAPAQIDVGAIVEEAERASRAGDYATAIRLRFKAGIARLGRRGVIVGGEHTTNLRISDQLGLEEFDRLASSFERVVYGGQEADAGTDDESRTTWPAVIEKARR